MGGGGIARGLFLLAVMSVAVASCRFIVPEDKAAATKSVFENARGDIFWVEGTPPVDSIPVTQGWRGLLLGEPLDLKSATEEDLLSLPGVGPSTAASIIKTREEGFSTGLSSLENAHGIGKVKFQRLRKWFASSDL